MAASGQLSDEGLEGTIFAVEISRFGGVRPAACARPIEIGAREQGVRRTCVSAANACEAAIVSDHDVFPVSILADVVRRLEMPEVQPRLDRGAAPAAGGWARQRQTCGARCRAPLRMEAFMNHPG